MITFVTSAILSADYLYLQLLSYTCSLSNDHFLESCPDCLVTDLKRLLNVLYFKVTALDKNPDLLGDCLYQKSISSAFKVMQTRRGCA